MFGLGDDFDLDDHFLDEVFEAEKTSAISRNEPKPYDHSPNLEETHLNFLGEPSASTRDSGCSYNGITNSLLGFAEESLSLKTVVTRNQAVKNDNLRKVRERKFPGPAGLLPDRQGNTSLVTTEDFINEIEEELKEDNKYEEDEVLSQESARRLESPAWSELMKDLGIEGKTLLSQLNVASVCSKAKLSRALKVPFLALLIQNVDASTADPCLYLSDSTGEMVGAVHREVWENLGKDLLVGTVIVLINVGVLCAGSSSSRLYLNITANNIAALYSPTNSSDIRITSMKAFSQPDCSSFLRTWRELLTTPNHPPISSETNRQLFSTASLSPSNLPHRRPNSASPSLSRSFNISFNSPLSCASPRFNQSLSKPVNNFSPSPQPNYTRYSHLKTPPPTNKLRHNQVPNINTPVTRPKPSIHGKQNNSNQHILPKRPRYDLPNQSVQFESQNTASQSVVESLLDGIDTDSLFGDF